MFQNFFFTWNISLRRLLYGLLLLLLLRYAVVSRWKLDSTLASLLLWLLSIAIDSWPGFLVVQGGLLGLKRTVRVVHNGRVLRPLRARLVEADVDVGQVLGLDQTHVVRLKGVGALHVLCVYLAYNVRQVVDVVDTTAAAAATASIVSQRSTLAVTIDHTCVARLLVVQRVVVARVFSLNCRVINHA